MLTNKNFYTQIIGLCFSFTPGCKLDTVSRFAFCVLCYEVCLQFVRDFFVCSVGCVIISCPVHVLEPLLCTCFFSLWLTVFLVCLNSLFIIQGDLLETALSSSLFDQVKLKFANARQNSIQLESR